MNLQNLIRTPRLTDMSTEQLEAIAIALDGTINWERESDALATEKMVRDVMFVLQQRLGNIEYLDIDMKIVNARV